MSESHEEQASELTEGQLGEVVGGIKDITDGLSNTLNPGESSSRGVTILGPVLPPHLVLPPKP